MPNLNDGGISMSWQDKGRPSDNEWWLGWKRGGYCFLRYPRSMNERRQQVDFGHLTRLKRQHLLPRLDPWGDFHRSDFRNRSWKRQRLTQYKNVYHFVRSESDDDLFFRRWGVNYA